MTYETHQKFSLFWALIGVMILYTSDLMSINYYLALILVIPYASTGAKFPDLDHGWHNIKDKNVVTFIINQAIHLTKGRHRSWQTHSIDIVTILTVVGFILPGFLVRRGILEIDLVSLTIINIIFVGFMLGWWSHIVADMMTPDGVRLTCFRDFKVKLVPRKFLWFSFGTGGEWEEFICKLTGWLNIVVTIIALIYPLLAHVQL